MFREYLLRFVCFKAHGLGGSLNTLGGHCLDHIGVLLDLRNCVLLHVVLRSFTPKVRERLSDSRTRTACAPVTAPASFAFDSRHGAGWAQSGRDGVLHRRWVSLAAHALCLMPRSYSLAA